MGVIARDQRYALPPRILRHSSACRSPSISRRSLFGRHPSFLRLVDIAAYDAQVPIFDHLGVTVANLSRATEQFDAVMQALGFTREDADGSVSWWREDETELILFPPRPGGAGSHRHGRVGWQHLAFAVDSRAEVDRLHAIALDAGWAAVRNPKLYPRFNDRYYASFVEDDSGIRIEFMHNPPGDATVG